MPGTIAPVGTALPASVPFCPACYSRTQAPKPEIYQSWRLYECADCGLQHFWPPRNPGAEWYEQSAMYEGRDSVVDWLAWYHRQGLARLPTRSGRLIDIGCGNGTFVAEAERLGFEATGIDFSEKAIEMGRRRFGLSRLHRLSVEELHDRCPDQQFDVVTAFEVLEHMEDVGAFLREIDRILRPGGHLVVSVPHRDRIPFLTEGDRPPHHFTRWSRAAMRNVMVRYGFTVQSLTISPASQTVKHWLLVNLRFGVVMGSLRRVRTDAGTARSDPGLDRARSLILLKDLFATIAGTAAGPLFAPFVRGHMMVTIATKPSR